MGLLAPLYALAALAVAGPILLHLIRRQPQGQIPFSSLMFLRTSPPRLTRRSRLDNLWLLLLRGLALLLIALAFSRPYWRQKELAELSGPVRTVAILLDVSASMQRDDVWKAAIQESERVLADLHSQDQVALYTIDNQLKSIVSIEAITQAKQSAEMASLKSLVADSLRNLRPTWNGSKLSTGLIGLAEQLNAGAMETASLTTGNSQIVLISDFHTESGIEELQGYAWPKQIDLNLRIVGSDQPGNARASLMYSDEAAIKPIAGTKIRIENNAHSPQSSFSLQWRDPQGNALGPTTAVQVMAGQVRVVTMPTKPEHAQQVQLIGDTWQADNTVYVPTSQQIAQRILYCGSQGVRPEEDLSYFLAQAPLSNGMFQRQVQIVSPDELDQLSLANDVLAIVIEPTEQVLARTDVLRKLAKRGLSILLVLTEQSAQIPGVESFLSSLLAQDSALTSSLDVKLVESNNAQPAMIAYVDYKSSVFSSLADPRFNDFSKIRIWKYRQVQWRGIQTGASQETGQAESSTMNSQTEPEILAHLDDRSPWLVRRQLGLGHIWLISSGWQTTESSFALSSKFIPVMMRILDPNPRQTNFARVVEVGQQIDLEDSPPYVITNQLGQVIDRSQANEDNKFQFNEPGLYNIRGSRWNQQLAVQISASESRLMPMDPSLLAQYGLVMEKLESEADLQERLRQMKTEELEEQQRLWKWLLVAGLGSLLIETFCAGWAARSMQPEV